jgi:hypothetical protein
MALHAVFPYPFDKPTFFANGIANANGFLYTYLAGSTTPVNTYRNSDGNDAQLNDAPIELDAYGQPPEGIYLDETIAYRFDLFDAELNLIWTRDNIISAFAGTGDAVLTTGDQNVEGTKAFNNVCGFGFGDNSEYVDSPLQIVVGSQTETGVGMQFVASGPASTAVINFGTNEVGSTSYIGQITYDYSTNTLIFRSNNATALTLSPTQATFATPTLTLNGVSVVKSTDIIAITKGGTGQVTANAALNALLPTQTTFANKFLQTDGTNTSWQTLSGGPQFLPAGQPYLFFTGSNALSWTSFDTADAGVPSGATAVIVQTNVHVEHTENSPYDYKFWVCARVDSAKGNTFGTPEVDTYTLAHVLDSISFSTTQSNTNTQQSTIPIRSDGTFDYITSQGVTVSTSTVKMWIVGYYN